MKPSVNYKHVVFLCECSTASSAQTIRGVLITLWFKLVSLHSSVAMIMWKGKMGGRRANYTRQCTMDAQVTNRLDPGLLFIVLQVIKLFVGNFDNDDK